MGAIELCSPGMAHPKLLSSPSLTVFPDGGSPFLLLPIHSAAILNSSVLSSAQYSAYLFCYHSLGFSMSLYTVKAQCLPVSSCFLSSCCSPLTHHLKFYIFNLLKIFIAYILGTWLLLLAEGVLTAHGIPLHRDIFIQVCWANLLSSCPPLSPCHAS